MKITSLETGPFAVNCYIISDKGECAIIDPGGNAEKILTEAQRNRGEIKYIILTHGHFDHIGAVAELERQTNAKVYIHKEDEIMLTDMDKNLSFMHRAVEPSRADVLLYGGEELPLGSIKLKIYHTPGHSSGGIVIFTDGVLFSGDLLFRGSVGRFDYGDFRVELESLKFLTEVIPDDTVVYPGHGAQTTMEFEKKNNPYIINHIN